MIKEKWKPIIGFEKLYKISNYGRVYSIKNKLILRTNDNGLGYQTVSLFKNKKYTVYYIHRLVATHFIINKLKKRTVNHIDGNKLNNKVNNLEWCTYKENMSHAIKNNLNAYGKRIHTSKLSFIIAENIRKEYSTQNISQRKLAKKYKVSQRAIAQIIHNITWNKE